MHGRFMKNGRAARRRQPVTVPRSSERKPRLDTPQSSSTQPGVVRCHVATYGAVRATPDDLGQWRRQPPPVCGVAVPASLVKHSEDQTLAALAALHSAITRSGWVGRTFTDWGVVAAPNFLGRGGTASSIQRFADDGAWGVSPHLIPHQSLHAVSGTVSHLLRIHGPNFGISGGPQACHDAFLIAAPMLAEGTLPGLWLLLSGHDREHIPAEDGKGSSPPRAPHCEAAALALVPEHGAVEGMLLSISPEVARTRTSELTLSDLVEALIAEEPVAKVWRMPGAGWIALEEVALSAGSRR